MDEQLELIEHGITTETAEWRCHVCFKVGVAYFFRVEDACKVLDKGIEKTVMLNGTVTGRGKLVRPEDIPGIQPVNIPRCILRRHWCNEDDGESLKGRMALNVCIDLLYTSWKVKEVTEITDKGLQIKGQDLFFDSKTMEVKCDWPGGPRELGGTGYLFLQTAERNPRKKH